MGNKKNKKSKTMTKITKEYFAAYKSKIETDISKNSSASSMKLSHI